MLTIPAPSIWVPDRKIWTPNPLRIKRRQKPRRSLWDWVFGTSGDVILDSSGKRILDSSGKVALDDGAGCTSCCGSSGFTGGCTKCGTEWCANSTAPGSLTVTFALTDTPATCQTGNTLVCDASSLRDYAWDSGDGVSGTYTVPLNSSSSTCCIYKASFTGLTGPSFCSTANGTCGAFIARADEIDITVFTTGCITNAFDAVDYPSYPHGFIQIDLKKSGGTFIGAIVFADYDPNCTTPVTVANGITAANQCYRVGNTTSTTTFQSPGGGGNVTITGLNTSC